MSDSELPPVDAPEARPRKRFPWLNVILGSVLLIIVLVVVVPPLLPRRCIVEGMMVDTPAGPRPIQDLRPGDEVWSRTLDGSPKTGRVIRTLPARRWGFLRIRFSDGGV